MFRQHTALPLRENTNEAESIFTPTNAIHFVSKLIIFQNGLVEPDAGKNLGWMRSDMNQSMN